MNIILAISFSFCVTGCLTFVCFHFLPYVLDLSVSYWDFFQWMRMCSKLQLLELGTPRTLFISAASSLHFPISLCTVAVHRQITWFRATVVSWPKLYEAMNLHHCKEPVSITWVISSSPRFQFTKAIF